MYTLVRENFCERVRGSNFVFRARCACLILLLFLSSWEWPGSAKRKLGLHLAFLAGSGQSNACSNASRTCKLSKLDMLNEAFGWFCLGASEIKNKEKDLF